MILSTSYVIAILSQVVGLAPNPRLMPELHVTPERTTILVGDPLLVKATFRSGAQRMSTFKVPFCAAWGGVGFELRKPQSISPERLLAYGEGTSCGYVPQPIEVKAGQERVSYESFFYAGTQDNPPPAFSQPGTWSLRAFTMVDGKRLESRWIEIQVAARSQRMQEVWTDNIKPIAASVWFGAPIYPDSINAPPDIESLLAGSNASGAIARTRRLIALRHAATLRVRQDAMDALNKLREDLPPVSQEFLDLQTVDVLLRRKEYAEAESLLKRIKDSSYIRDSLVARLENDRRVKR
jgi:hypothetical protein